MFFFPRIVHDTRAIIVSFLAITVGSERVFAANFFSTSFLATVRSAQTHEISEDKLVIVFATPVILAGTVSQVKRALVISGIADGVWDAFYAS